MNELTDRTQVLVLKGGIELYVSDKEAESVKRALSQKVDAFELQGRYITSWSVLYIISALDFKPVEMKRRGMWQCSKGTWHPKEYTDCSC
jgi:hypothetical protein